MVFFKSFPAALIVLTFLAPMMGLAAQRPHFCETGHRFFDSQILAGAEEELDVEAALVCPIDGTKIFIGNDLKIPERKLNPYPAPGRELSAMNAFKDWVTQNAPVEMTLSLQPIDARCNSSECRVRLATGLSDPKEVRGTFRNGELKKLEGLSFPRIKAFIATSSELEILNDQMNGYFVVSGVAQNELYLASVDNGRFYSEPVTSVSEQPTGETAYAFKCGKFVLGKEKLSQIYKWSGYSKPSEGIVNEWIKVDGFTVIDGEKSQKGRLVLKSLIPGGHGLDLVLVERASKQTVMQEIRSAPTICK